MKVALCVLYHPGVPERDAVWRWSKRRWEAWGYEPIEGSAERGLFGARNEAARTAGDWDVALFADADVALGGPLQAQEAIVAASAGAYGCAFSRFCYLGEEMTEHVLRGEPLAGGTADRCLPGLWLGAFAIGRPLWDEIGGFDERFAGRAGQDVAFLKAAATLGRLHRVVGDAFHLWHPPAVGRTYAPALSDAYARAEHHPDEMRALLRSGGGW